MVFFVNFRSQLFCFLAFLDTDFSGFLITRLSNYSQPRSTQQCSRIICSRMEIFSLIHSFFFFNFPLFDFVIFLAPNLLFQLSAIECAFSHRNAPTELNRKPITKSCKTYRIASTQASLANHNPDIIKLSYPEKRDLIKAILHTFIRQLNRPLSPYFAMSKPAVYTSKKKRKLGDNSVASIFESSRKPNKKKIYIHNKDASEQLIKIPKRVKVATSDKDLDFDKLDKLLSEKTNETSQNSQLTEYSSLPQDILRGDIEQMNLDTVREKYIKRTFPLPQSKAKLKEKVGKHLEVIPKILAGEEELSFYYTLASDQRKQLLHLVMTLDERWDIKWEKYVAGFYGLKRQNFVASLIQAKYLHLLMKLTNKTVRYWGPDMFATYVLANEIILRLVMEDLDLEKDLAEKLLKDTVDYGCKLADEKKFEDDLEFDELIG